MYQIGDVAGSPPPMRGKGLLPDFSVFSFGITPAYAGKRNAERRNFQRFWDHPRLCGEKTLHLAHLILRVGSPPPMRGKVCRTLIASTRSGITHAYAGKSMQQLYVIKGKPDHPRLCGEKRRRV